MFPASHPIPFPAPRPVQGASSTQGASSMQGMSSTQGASSIQGASSMQGMPSTRAGYPDSSHGSLRSIRQEALDILKAYSDGKMTDEVPMEYSEEEANTIRQQFRVHGHTAMNQLNLGRQSVGFIKAYEMFRSIKGVKTALFNAELPGGFVKAAIQKYGGDNGVDMEWLASSYLPRDTDEVDDQIRGRDTKGMSYLKETMGMYSNFPDNWTMGPKRIEGKNVWITGDMTDYRNIQYLAAKTLGTLGPVDLYTADGFVSRYDDANERTIESDEVDNIDMFIGQVLVGVMTCSGTLIVKFFSGEKVQTKLVLQYLTKHFKSTRIVKPWMSGPTNGELYVIAEGRKTKPKLMSMKEIRSTFDALRANKGSISRGIVNIIKRYRQRRNGFRAAVRHLADNGALSEISSSLYNRNISQLIEMFK